MASVPIQFRKAIKYAARGRVSLIGPAGSGKSFTALKLARLLAGPQGKIAAIDTEHGSLSKYADLFDFDVFEMSDYTPENFIDAITAAEQHKYDVFVTDSLSHFWVGKNGALEFVDMASKRHKDNMGGWKEFRPHERAMVDRMIASPCHIIVTMRTKTEYVEEVDDRGKKKRRKVGLAPVQREGLEYEFDLVGYMDEDNTLIVDKTRCSAYTGKAFTKPGDKEFEPFRDWLKGVKRDVPQQLGPKVVPTTWDWKVVLPHFEAIEQQVGFSKFHELLGAEGYAKLEDLPNRDEAARVYKAVSEAAADISSVKAQAPTPAPRDEKPMEFMPPEVEALWKRITNIKTACEVFGELKAEMVKMIGEEDAVAFYHVILARFGAGHANDFRNMGKARQCASALWGKIQDLKEIGIPNNPNITDEDLPPALFDASPMAYGVD